MDMGTFTAVHVPSLFYNLIGVSDVKDTPTGAAKSEVFLLLILTGINRKSWQKNWVIEVAGPDHLDL